MCQLASCYNVDMHRGLYEVNVKTCSSNSRLSALSLCVTDTMLLL